MKAILENFVPIYGLFWRILYLPMVYFGEFCTYLWFILENFVPTYNLFRALRSDRVTKRG